MPHARPAVTTRRKWIGSTAVTGEAVAATAGGVELFMGHANHDRHFLAVEAGMDGEFETALSAAKESSRTRIMTSR